MTASRLSAQARDQAIKPYLAAGALPVVARYLYNINVCHLPQALGSADGAMVGPGEEDIADSQV